MSCVAPISWLALEQYHLGELSPPRMDEVRAHLAACASCRGCLDAIVADDRSLPALTASPAIPSLARRRIGPAALGLTTLAAAAAFLVLARRPHDDAGTTLATNEAPGEAVKGGTFTFTIVRESGAVVEGDSFAYADGERVKARVTCPPGELTAGVAVFDEGGMSLPLPARRLVCGNAVDLPGALRLSGKTMRICLLFATASERLKVERSSDDAGAYPMICKTATPSPRSP